MTIMELFRTTNWQMLVEQKETLVALAWGTDGTLLSFPLSQRRREHLRGLVHLLDAFQDAAVDAGLRSEREVFGNLEAVEMKEVVEP